MMTPARKHNGRDAEPTTLKITDGDRLPPQNLEAEQSVLGSILLDWKVLHDIAPFLKAEDFWRDSHQIIFRAMLDLYEAAKVIDAIVLAEELTRRDQFKAIGGDEALARLIDSVPSGANAVYHAGIVRQKSIVRQVIEGCNGVIHDAYSNQFTAEQVLETAERVVFEIADQEISGETFAIDQTAAEAMERLMRRGRHGEVDGIGTGLQDLDDIMGGLKAPHLIMVGARPSMGKTAFAMQLADYVSTEQKISTLVISLEMGREDLTDRLLCARARVDNHKVRTGQNLMAAEWEQLNAAYEQLRPSPIRFDDAAGRSMLQIFAAARRAKLRHNLGLLIIDYIQLIDVGQTRDSRQEQVAKMSRQLKALARELKIPVVALSQLNRQVETREERRPRMADLRESGALEQDADIVLLLHRTEYYDPNDQPGIAEIIIGKNRHGATGLVRTTFLKNIGRFESIATNAPPLEAF